MRFIAATNRDIVKAVQDGAFREDLYYRINVVTIKVPPLRERREDVIVLARHFLEKYSSDIGKPVKFIDDSVLDLLTAYNWPGNVRELQNIIERGVLITESNTIFPEHLPEAMRIARSFLSESLHDGLSIEAYTKEFIIRHQENCTEQKLADMLGITRKALWEKRKRWDIRRA
jgi:transcriptional regulator with PAS, ATPase and Fis domain